MTASTTPPRDLLPAAGSSQPIAETGLLDSDPGVRALAAQHLYGTMIPFQERPREFTVYEKGGILCSSGLCWALGAYLIYQFVVFALREQTDQMVCYEVLCFLGAFGATFVAIMTCCMACTAYKN